MEIRSNLNNNKMSFGSNAVSVLLKEIDVPMGTLQYLGKSMIETGKLCDEKQLSPISEKLVAALDKFEKDVPAGKFDGDDNLVLRNLFCTLTDFSLDFLDASKERINNQSNITDIEKFGKEAIDIYSNYITSMYLKLKNICDDHGGLGKF